MTEAQMEPSDYFLEDTYKDASGKENRCYQFTKLGCDFIANKFTGEKGILFTAKYVKRFHEMQTTLLEYKPKSTINPECLNGFANIVNSLRRVMKDQGCGAAQIAEQVKLLCDAYGVPIIQYFVKPNYEQITFSAVITQKNRTFIK